MKKIIKSAAAVILVVAGALSAAAEDDDLFGDTVIDGTTQTDVSSAGNGSTTAEQTDSAHGTIFRNGTVKVGGQFDMSLTSLTRFNESTSAEESVRQTVLSPLADALFTIDARPSDNLRLYFKSGIHYPYLTETNAVVGTTGNSQKSTQNLFYVRELFTDFAIRDTAYFRFGKQTITWGTGCFFSPAGNTVNLSAIDPEDTTKQVEGPLALRTQIVFKGSQNCIWAYMIPDTSFLPSSITGSSTYTMASNTAFAVKGDIVSGGWELGPGAYYKYGHAPKALLTVSGTLFNKINTFGECVYAYGTDADWSTNVQWDNKDSIWQATAGGSYTWKEPQITFAGQYYYDGNDDDTWDTSTHGHNIAALVSFAKVFTTDITASVYGNINFGADLCTTSAMLYYSPVNELKLGAGPYIVWSSLDKSPDTAVKLSAELSGGKF
ncbi:MAG: hypothetical protein M0P01_06180 [Treponema sp.]|nr:hypothetical protein [Treponema sp.]